MFLTKRVRPPKGTDKAKSIISQLQLGTDVAGPYAISRAMEAPRGEPRPPLKPPLAFQVFEMRFHLQSLTCRAGLALSLLLFAEPTRADVAPYPSCDRDPTESDVSAAKGAYDAGEVSFQEADYDRALLYWEDAFRRDCTAVKLLLNIARAYELNRNYEAAVNALQTYVDRRPDDKDRISVEKRIAKLKELVDSQGPPKLAEEAVPEEAEEGDSPPHLAPPPEAPARPTSRPVWPLVLTGVGVAGAVFGHTAAVIQQRRIEDRKDAIAVKLGCDPDTNECTNDAMRDAANDAVDNDAEIADLRTKRDAANSVAGLGHLMGITGGVLWWIVWTQHKSPEKSADAGTYFEPVVAPGYQGLSLSGRF